MSHLPRTLLPALALVVLAILGAGCGGGDVAAGEVPGNPPALTVRSDSELRDATSTDDTAGAAADASSDEAAGSSTPDAEATVAPDAGATAPEATVAPTPEQDSAGAEQPAADSAPEQFESFCEQNAGAC